MLTNLKTVVFCAVIGFLPSCTTINGPSTKPKPKETIVRKAEGLAPQTLEKGECGLFLWTNTEPRIFTFFENPKTTKYLLYRQGKTYPLTRTSTPTDYQISDRFDEAFINPEIGRVKLKGQFSKTLENGRRVNAAILSVANDEEWQEIIPVSGVYACQTP